MLCFQPLTFIKKVMIFICTSRKNVVLSQIDSYKKNSK